MADETDAGGTKPDAGDSGGDSSGLSAAQQATVSRGNVGPVVGCPKKKHWIEIKLQDEKGDPIPNERYVITGPDGEKHSGSLDAKGFVHIDGLDPGECEVKFPELYQRYRPDLVTANLPGQS